MLWDRALAALVPLFSEVVEKKRSFKFGVFPA
jgi:hypothetical protein